MENIIVWGVDWLPPIAQGLVRDLRVRWALEEAGLAYKCRATSAAERNSAAYRNKHPFGKVPVVESSDGVMFESGAIVYHVAEQCDALMPCDLRAETLTWMFAALDTIEPPLWNLLVIDLLHADEEWAKLRRPGAIDEAKARLAALAEWLDDRDFLLGRFTAADLLMTTVLRFIRHTDLVAGFPRLDAYVKRCEAQCRLLRLRKRLLPEGLAAGVLGHELRTVARSEASLRSRRPVYRASRGGVGRMECGRV